MLRYYKDIIGISVQGVVTMPSCLNTSRIHKKVSGCEKMVQMVSTGRVL